MPVGVGSVREARTVPFHRSLPGLLRDPLGAIEEMGRELGRAGAE